MPGPVATAVPPQEGDAAFIGVNSRLDPSQLPAGFLTDGRNIRVRAGQVETRLGVVKPLWANIVNDGVIMPSQVICGAGVFKDPDGLEWSMRATDGEVYRMRPYTAPYALTLAEGVRITTPVAFTQAFNKLYMWRGTHIAPLVLSSLDTGFEDLVEEYDASAVYVASVNGSTADEVAYGPLVTLATLTGMGNTATGTTSASHGYVTGQLLRIRGAAQAEYNGRWTITVVDDVTFTYQFGGSATATATGTITASTLMNYWKALGKTITLATLTHVTVTATATLAGHGFVNGDSVTIAGATPNGYNGTFVISGVAANTFQYTMAADPGANATGTITAYNPRIPAGEDPVTKPDNWLQLYTILPPAENGIYVQNRMAVPTGFNPSTGTIGKKDFVVATDVLDNLHFDFPNEFRINEGSSDELITIVKFNDTTVLAFKDHTIAVILNVALDLSQVALDTQTTEYGLTGPRAVVVVGNDCYFLAARRGIVSMRQTEQNKLQGVDLPISDRVDDVMRRINWTLASKAAFAYWDNKLFCALPIDDGQVVGKDSVPAGATYSSSPFPRPFYEVTGLIIGRTYRYVEDPDADQPFLQNGTNSFGASQDFVATATTATFTSLSPGAAVGARLCPVFSGVNNCVLIYDFLTGAFTGRGAATAVSASTDWVYGATRGEWSGRDTGTAIMVREWFKATLNGQERLFFLAEDGFVNLYEESDCGDQVYDPTTSTGLVWEEITTYWKTRGYTFDSNSFKRFPDMDMILATWNCSYSLNQVMDGVNESVALVTDKTRDRTIFDRPFDAPPYDLTNADENAGDPYRQDYSTPVPEEGLQLGSGVAVDNHQTSGENLRGSRQQGSMVQYEFTCTQGRIKMKSCQPSAVGGKRRRGALT